MRHHCLDVIHNTIRVSKKLFDIIRSIRQHKQTEVTQPKCYIKPAWSRIGLNKGPSFCQKQPWHPARSPNLVSKENQVYQQPGRDPHVTRFATPGLLMVNKNT
jgi:hypothetical protein